MPLTLSTFDLGAEVAQIIEDAISGAVPQLQAAAVAPTEASPDLLKLASLRDDAAGGAIAAAILARRNRQTTTELEDEFGDELAPRRRRGTR